MPVRLDHITPKLFGWNVESVEAGLRVYRFLKVLSREGDAKVSMRNKETYGAELLGDHSECVPPDPIPNSEVKPLSADDSVADCHVKVGNCQALIPKPRSSKMSGVFFCQKKTEYERIKATRRTVSADGGGMSLVLTFCAIGISVNKYKFSAFRMAIFCLIILAFHKLSYN